MQEISDRTAEQLTLLVARGAELSTMHDTLSDAMGQYNEEKEKAYKRFEHDMHAINDEALGRFLNALSSANRRLAVLEYIDEDDDNDVA